MYIIKIFYKTDKIMFVEKMFINKIGVGYL